MNQPEKVWRLLQRHPWDDPRVRSYLIHRLGPLGANPETLIKRLDQEQDVSSRRALLLALGEFGEKELSPGERKVLLRRLLGLYRADPDPGLHGAAEYLLLRWGQQLKLKELEEEWREDRGKEKKVLNEIREKREEKLGQIRKELAKDKPEPQWYVNCQGQTMVVIPGPVTFQMGSPPEEAGRAGGQAGTEEMRHGMRIGRSFAIALREVTVEQFLRFRKDHDYSKEFSPSPECPVNQVLWYDAAAYCNWLSEQEGIDKKEWCYLSNKDDRYAEGMKLAPNYLCRLGYRLPSEAEWEYACRAGALTSRYYGEGEELLGQYAWYTKNSQDRGMLPGAPGQFGVPGGRLKPNDFGLFDMLGNAAEWCQEAVPDYSPGPKGKVADDTEDKTTVIEDKMKRVMRGGSCFTQASIVRSARRFWYVPSPHLAYVGFRPARTFR
jgi:formylglycine-generating enzyme required for sulfatase activity